MGSNKNIVYIYNATGQKLKKVVTNNTSINTTDYLDGFQYLKTGSAGVVKLQFFPTAEGYVSNTVVSGVNNFKYIYNYQDHLGNNRLSYSKNNTTTAILEENNYYPFGLKHNNYNLNKAYFDACAAEADLCFNAVNNVPWAYRFNNKEFQGELGLNWYDFEGRNYMPDIVRTPTQDPLSWKFSSQSPYSFLNNNPIKFIDPTGMSAQSNDWHRDDSGTLVADKGDTAETLATYLSISIEDARAEFNHSHYHYEGVMSGGERLYNSDKAVSSAEYGPSSIDFGLSSLSSWFSDNQSGYAFADGGNNQDPGSLNKGSRDAQWVDFKGMLEIFTILLGHEYGAKTPNGKGTNGGKPITDDKVGNAIDAVDAGAGATKEATAKDSIRTTTYGAYGKEVKSEIRVKRDGE